MEDYSEKKWKIFKNNKSSSHQHIDSSYTRSYSPPNNYNNNNMNNNNNNNFLRSYSQKPSSSSSSSYYSKNSCNSPSSPTLVRSKSCKNNNNNNNNNNNMRNFSKKSNAFGKKCSNIAKEQKAKFYIVKRCVSMLVSWRRSGDS
ncbi:hypothetical protein vseg_013132 [Gypsophila vaccaria]